MRMLISVSAAKPTMIAGSRVAVEFGKDDWSIGTVRKIVPTGHRVDLDYGAENVLIKQNKMILVNRKLKLKKDLTRLQVKALEFSKLVVKPKPEPKPEPIVIKPVIKKRIKIDLTPDADKKIEPIKTVEVEPTKVRDLEHTPNLPEEVKLEHKVGDAKAFSIASAGSTKAKHDYLVMVWEKANDVLFSVRMLMPHFQMLKVMRDVKSLGSWTPNKRLLKISPRLFNATQAHAITVIVHEMCHQAVSELDKVHSALEGNGGHGPRWNNWMRHCGLSPDRYNKDDASTFLTEEEKDKRALLISNMELARSQRPRVQPRIDCPAMWHNPHDNTWHKGLIVCKFDLAGKRWSFIEKPSADRWSNVPQGLFFELDAEERQQFLTQEFKNASKSIREYHDSERRMKRIAREAKKNPYNQYGTRIIGTPDQTERDYDFGTWGH